MATEAVRPLSVVAVVSVAAVVAGSDVAEHLTVVTERYAD